jgi:hypothetical protein
MFTQTDLVMSDGTKMHADIVKVHGKMYAMIPVDDLPDYLHQPGRESDAPIKYPGRYSRFLLVAVRASCSLARPFAWKGWSFELKTFTST